MRPGIPVFNVDFVAFRKEFFKKRAEALQKAIITGQPVEQENKVAVVEVRQLHQAKGLPEARLFAKVVAECRNCPMLTEMGGYGGGLKYCAPLSIYAKYPVGWDRMGILAECPLPPAKEAIFVEEDQPLKEQPKGG